MDLARTPSQLEVVERVRALVAGPVDPAGWEAVVGTAPGFDPALWSALLASGTVTVGFPESVGGSGGGLGDLAVVVEELGRGPVPTPLLDGVVLSGLVLAGADPSSPRLADRQADLLAGRRRFATALVDTGDDRRDRRPGVTAARTGRGWTLGGAAWFVGHAVGADTVLVEAVTGGPGVDSPGGLFAVDPRAAGVTVEPVPTLDGAGTAHLVLTDVTVDDDAVVAYPGTTASWLPGVRDTARLVAAAEMVGAASAALDHAADRARARVQFGVPIGSFQAVQQRMADALIDVVTSRDAVFDALGALERGDGSRPRTAAALAHCADACRRVTATAHQVGGGDGILADSPLHCWHRRVAALVAAVGTVPSHRRAVAAALFDS